LGSQEPLELIQSTGGRPLVKRRGQRRSREKKPHKNNVVRRQYRRSDHPGERRGGLADALFTNTQPEALEDSFTASRKAATCKKRAGFAAHPGPDPARYSAETRRTSSRSGPNHESGTVWNRPRQSDRAKTQKARRNFIYGLRLKAYYASHSHQKKNQSGRKGPNLIRSRI